MDVENGRQNSIWILVCLFLKKWWLNFCVYILSMIFMFHNNCFVLGPSHAQQ